MPRPKTRIVRQTPAPLTVTPPMVLLKPLAELSGTKTSP